MNIKLLFWLNVLGISKHTISINKSSGIAINQTYEYIRVLGQIGVFPYDERAQLIGKRISYMRKL